jgi:hypothetical protein
LSIICSWCKRMVLPTTFQEISYMTELFVINRYYSWTLKSFAERGRQYLTWKFLSFWPNLRVATWWVMHKLIIATNVPHLCCYHKKFCSCNTSFVVCSWDLLSSGMLCSTDIFCGGGQKKTLHCTTSDKSKEINFIFEDNQLWAYLESNWVETNTEQYKQFC